MKNDLHIRLIDNYKDFSLLENDWHKMADNRHNPMLDYDWYYQCAKAFYEEENLRIVAICNGDNMIAVAPLVKRNKHGMEYLEVIGSSCLNEPTDFLYSTDESCNVLIKAVISLRKSIILNRIPVHSYVENIFCNHIYNNRGFVIKNEINDGSSYFNISNSWEDIEKNFSKNRREHFRKWLKNANKKGAVGWENIYPAKEELVLILDEVFRVESSSWKKQSGTAVLLNPEYKNFFYGYGMKQADKGNLLVSFMKIDGKNIASQYSIVRDKILWELKIGYDDKYSDCSPGILLKNSVMKYCVENGIKNYEFLGYIEKSVHGIWTKDYHQYCTIKYIPLNYNGIRNSVLSCMKKLKIT